MRWRPAAMSRFCSTESSSKTLAVWNVRPTPSRTILCTGLAEQLLLAEPRRPGGLGEPRDGVDAGRLAGAVRADEEPDLAGVRVEGDAVDRDEARELDVEVRDDERGVGHDFTSSSSGAAVAAAGCSPGLRRAAVNLASTDDSPFGRKRMTTMNSRPMM